MDFDSPDVMKDFPGLYACDLNRKCNNDSDYSDEADKINKKEMLIGKRKDKKDKKDKDKGYAALEGESSADEECKPRSPSKSKKNKPFKFSTKSKDKREKSREKEKDCDKKKERDKKSEKKSDKEKNKKVKQSVDEFIDIAETLPIFGVNLETAIERSRCHDGVDIPLPIRECIDYIESVGMSFENIYKVSGTKSKVLLIRKMYNNRQKIKLEDYDVPTATSLLKMFLRDLPEPIFTSDLLVRFEEAGAILNLNTREKHLKILVDNLPRLNKLLLSWLIVHLDNVSLNNNMNKMTKQNLSAALNHTFHTSSKLLHALLLHSKALFPDLKIVQYVPPLISGQQLPEDLESIELELKKQESLLTQIHTEMKFGCIPKEREELLWEVQRIITQLKRKIKSARKEKEIAAPENEQNTLKQGTATVSEDKSAAVPGHISDTVTQATTEEEHCTVHVTEPPPELNPNINALNEFEQSVINGTADSSIHHVQEEPKNVDATADDKELKNSSILVTDNNALLFLKFKNKGLTSLKDQLTASIMDERKEIANLKSQLMTEKMITPLPPSTNDGLDELMSLLQKENQILQITKINLVRKIIEQQEFCINLRAKLELASNF